MAFNFLVGEVGRDRGDVFCELCPGRDRKLV